MHCDITDNDEGRPKLPWRVATQMKFILWALLYCSLCWAAGSLSVESSEWHRGQRDEYFGPSKVIGCYKIEVIIINYCDLLIW